MGTYLNQYVDCSSSSGISTVAGAFFAKNADLDGGQFGKG
jgi:hypothetical protein